MLRERLSLIIENNFLPKIPNVKKAKYLVQVNPVQTIETTDKVISEIKHDVSEQKKSITKIISYLQESQETSELSRDQIYKIQNQIQELNSVLIPDGENKKQKK